VWRQADLCRDFFLRAVALELSFFGAAHADGPDMYIFECLKASAPAPLGVHKVVQQWQRCAGGPVDIEPLGHDEDRKGGGIAPRFRMIVLKPAVGSVSGPAARPSSCDAQAADAESTAEGCWPACCRVTGPEQLPGRVRHLQIVGRELDAKLLAMMTAAR
jgi:hypothetical protein